MSRIAVTGWGLLGQAVAARAVERGIEVFAVSRGIADGPRSRRLDLGAQPEPIVALLGRWSPDLVVHTAGATDVRACEVRPHDAYVGNVAATRSVAAAARSAGAALVALSSDWVFDGHDGGYREDDAIGPRNVYALTKAWAEEAVHEAGGTVVRGTFIGRRPDGREGLVERLLDAGRPAGVPRGKVASPLWVGDAAPAILDLPRTSDAPTVHLGSRDRIEWRALAARIRSRIGAEPVAELPQDDGVDRPGDTSLDVGAAERILGRRLPTVAQTVDAMLAAPPLRAAPAGTEVARAA